MRRFRGFSTMAKLEVEGLDVTPCVPVCKSLLSIASWRCLTVTVVCLHHCLGLLTIPSPLKPSQFEVCSALLVSPLSGVLFFMCGCILDCLQRFPHTLPRTLPLPLLVALRDASGFICAIHSGFHQPVRPTRISPHSSDRLLVIGPPLWQPCPLSCSWSHHVAYVTVYGCLCPPAASCPYWLSSPHFLMYCPTLGF